MRKKLGSLLLLLFMIICNHVAFAQAEENIILPIYDTKVVTVEDIQQYVEVVVQSRSEGIGYHYDDSARAGRDVIVPYLIRNGDSTEIQIYLAYMGTDLIDRMCFGTMTISSISFLFPTEYHTFYDGIGVIDGSATTGSAYIGRIYGVPTDEDYLIVRTTNLMAHRLSYGWISFSNISGSWKIN